MHFGGCSNTLKAPRGESAVSRGKFAIVDVRGRDVRLPANVGDSGQGRSPWNDYFDIAKWSLFGRAGSLGLVVGCEGGDTDCRNEPSAFCTCER